MIEHVFDAGDFLRKCRERLSTKGGAVFLSTPVRIKEVPDDPYHVHEFFPGELIELVAKAGFSVLEHVVSHEYTILQEYGQRHSVLGVGKMRLGKYIVNFSSMVLGKNPFSRRQCALPTMQYLLAIRSDKHAK